MENFGFFVIFGVNVRHFHSEQCNYSVIKDYWTTNFFFVVSRRHSNPRSVSNFSKNCIEVLKIGKFWVFCHFRSVCDIFTHKDAINSSGKPTGQNFLSLLILFNVPIHKVCQKFGKELYKIFGNWKISGFLWFSVSISDTFISKTAINTPKRILDNQPFPR